MTGRAGGIEVRLSRAGECVVCDGIRNRASGFDWAAPSRPVGPCLIADTLTVDGFADGTGLRFVSQERQSDRDGECRTSEWRSADGLRLSWSVRSPTRGSVVEYRARLRNEGSATVGGVTRLGPLALSLRGDRGALRVHWLDRSRYRLQSAALADDFRLSGGGWNAPEAAGWIAIEDAERSEVLFLGVAWESSWQLRLERSGDHVLLACALEGFDHALAPGEELLSPTVFMGVTHGDLDDSLRDLHDYLRERVLPPLPKDFPWVTYDIWGTEETGVEEALYAEVAFARDMGVEVFYHDASWYEGSCHNGSGDWFSGVGNWRREDRAKLPHGLAGLSERVHDAGMKFGLWFDPLVADSRLVGGVVPDAFVAKRDGAAIGLDLRNGWAATTQLCLGNPEVVEYLADALARAVRDFRLDWLKWDNSALSGQVCNRGDHGHAAGDGARAALLGEYEVYRRLHERFPDLVLENCGYPSRLDYGLSRYARANWLSDDTSQALKCRWSQIHGSYVLPASGNEAFVLNHGETLAEKDPAVLDTIMRSRMIGLFGMGTLNGKLSERLSLLPTEARDALRRNIAQYKRFRHLLSQDVYHVLPLAQDDSQWDGIEFCARDGREAVVMLFRSRSPDPARRVALRGLRAAARYRVLSLASGTEVTMPGADLLETGLSVELPRLDSSDVFLLRCTG